MHNFSLSLLSRHTHILYMGERLKMMIEYYILREMNALTFGFVSGEEWKNSAKYINYFIFLFSLWLNSCMLK